MVRVGQVDDPSDLGQLRLRRLQRRPGQAGRGNAASERLANLSPDEVARAVVFASRALPPRETIHAT